MTGADVFPQPTTDPASVRTARATVHKIGLLLTDVRGDVDDGALTLTDSWKGDAALSATQDIGSMRTLLHQDAQRAEHGGTALGTYLAALETARQTILRLQGRYDDFHADLVAANGRIKPRNKFEGQEERDANLSAFNEQVKPLHTQYQTAITDLDTARNACATALSALVTELSPVDMRGAAAGGTPDLDVGAYQAVAFTLNCAATTDRSMDADARAAQFDAFVKATGEVPKSENDWKVARMLDPSSYLEKNGGYPANLLLGRIPPQPGKGLVRVSWFIPVDKVFNVPDWDLGDGRGFDPNADPERSRVSVYIDYEHGLIIARNNPSVSTTGEVRVGIPDIKTQVLPDGRVRLFYTATNPFAPDAAKVTGQTVHGDIVVGSDHVSGRISDYPSFEVYHDRPDGTTQTLDQDEADSNVLGKPFGPLSELPFMHEVGTGGPAEMNDFYKKGMDGGRHDYEWRNPYLKYPDRYPFTELGSVDNPPDVQVAGGS